MSDNQRSYPCLSACGLNCGLCPRYHTDGSSRCPGCGGPRFYDKRPSCGVLSCCRRHGGIEYCYLCDEYPCAKYEGAACFDSFITHRRMREDFAKAKVIGIAAYQSELDEKVEMLRLLLDQFDDGRRKSFFCLAVNLLDLSDLREVMTRLPDGPAARAMAPKERTVLAVDMLQAKADERGIALKLVKKEK